MSRHKSGPGASLTEYEAITPRSHSPISSVWNSVPAEFRLPDGQPDYLRMILCSRVYEVMDETATTPAPGLSTKCGVEVMLKREDTSPVFSFKLRGAYNKIAQVPPEDRWKGVIACSAGNHAQGVAYGARQLGMPATIVMPKGTPAIKHENVSRLGSKVVFFGDDFDGAKAECQRLSLKHELLMIPPFDDPFVIAGQGTIAMEILRQVPIHKINTIYACIGGGGLLAGLSVYIKRVAPHIRIVGVETYDANAYYQSRKKGSRVVLSDVGVFADGTAVKVVGEETFRLLQENVDDIVLVNTDETCAAMKDIFEDTRAVVEPSGALAAAGMKRYLEEHPEIVEQGGVHIPIVSGANMNFDRLRFVAERAVLGEGGEVLMLVKIPERHGEFMKLINIIYPRNVTEFAYRYSDNPQQPAHIFMSFSVTDREAETKEVQRKLEENGMSGTDISDNELAKTHGRYLLGGRAHVPNEKMFRFEFPERPGALHKFLTTLNTSWNISLFHYRNYGADVGQVLAAWSVPPEEEDLLEKFLVDLNYRYIEETDNIIYNMLLCE
ncbi:hypothetical protein CANCADRAFT_73669 [Tortispora caseinolytica NRRL Y-17796]|uniref:Threonine dehydratase n=1 Tax=Tortispora caseinolytica NRRL Y-17796 TaxID=767744 RepID=A0A1E4TIP4_9ASCO|nr:hypothetical protein CANCADRAFT_73669 [Tortispora caseinolytica NRRL Y-17796]